MFDEYADEIDTRYRGIGGWLLFFIISIIFLSPLFAAINLFTTLSNTFVALHLPMLYLIRLFLGAIDLFFALVGIVVGILLWSRNQNAVGITQWFLMLKGVFVLVSNLVMYFLIHEGRIPPVVKNDLMTVILIWLIFGLIPVAIWYTYFAKSKRVAATYYALNEPPPPTELPPPPVFDNSEFVPDERKQ